MKQNNEPLNDNINEDVQLESWEEYQVRISAPGYVTPVVDFGNSPADDSPFTIQEDIQLILENIREISPAVSIGELIVKFLKSEQPDYSTQLQELIGIGEEIRDAIKENNRLLGDREEPPDATPEQTYPPKSPPTGQAGGKPRTEVSPAMKELRKIIKGGS